MDGLKQAMVTNTETALEKAIKNAKSIAGFNPPELRIARDMLHPFKVRIRVGEALKSKG